jgi:drug/metabolite transporter (DMT)-like permease
MNWLLLALIGPFLWSIGNHIDKILIEKYFKSRSMGSLIIISSLVGLFVAPIIFIFKPDVLNITIGYIFFMLVASILFVIYVWAYLKAMEQDEASIVVPFYQLIPVFAFILGYFFLGETITYLQFFAMFLIIAGAAIISFEIDEDNKFKLRKKTVFYMLISSFVSAVESVIFKYVLIREDFWITNFWSFLWIGVIGLVLLFSIKLYRIEFIYIIKNNSKRILSLNVFNEILTIVGNITTVYAFLLAQLFNVFFTLIVAYLIFN